MSALGVVLPNHFLLAGPSTAASHVCAGPYTVRAKDAYGVDFSVNAPLPVSLSGNLSGSFYSDSSCSTAISTITLATGASSGIFYYKTNMAENPVLTAAAAGVTPGAANVSAQMIASGQSHTCLAFNGIVKCWGANASGQLGNGNNSVQNSPTQVLVPAFSSGVTAVAAGWLTTCAIVNGGAWCWGDNTYGQLGNGVTGGSSNVPVQVSGLTSGVTMISAGMESSCAIKSGAAYCWGDNTVSELGTGSTGGSSNVPVPVLGLSSGVTFISAGFDHGCAVMNGANYCWGHNDNGPGSSPLGYASGVGSVPTPGIVTNMGSNVIWAVVAGLHACNIMKDATAWCWGNQDTTSNVGDNNLASTYVPTQIATGVTALALGQSNNPGNCLISNGSAYCWGQASSGNIGDGFTITRAVPTQVSGLTSGVIGITTGEDHACALMATGQVYCWGTGTSGQLGNGLGATSLTPVLAGPF